MATDKKKTPKAKKPKAKKPPTRLEILEEAEELLKRIEQQENRIQEARLEMDDIKERYKTTKDVYLTRMDEMRQLARARKEKLPLFDATKQPPPADGAPAAQISNAGDRPVLPGTNGYGIDPARSVDRLPIAELAKHGASGRAVEACEKAGFAIVKDLRDRMITNPEWWCKNAGINQRFKVGIEDAVNRAVEQASAVTNAKAENTDAAKDDETKQQPAESIDLKLATGT
jgi:hypothetical protein